MPLMIFFRLFRRDNHKDSARKLYISLVEQSRRPAFYMDCGVPDTMEGRFDMIALHAFLVMRRLKQDHGAAAELSQELFDIMFADMELIGIPHRIVVGDKSLDRGVYEYKSRRTTDAEEIEIDNVIEFLNAKFT